MLISEPLWTSNQEWSLPKTKKTFKMQHMKIKTITKINSKTVSLYPMEIGLIFHLFPRTVLRLSLIRKAFLTKI